MDQANQAAVKKLKEIVLRDCVKNPKRVAVHRKELEDPGLAPNYRQAVQEALHDIDGRDGR